MMHHDDFFTPEEVDRQIEQASQFKGGERADAEALAYLRSYYRADATQEQEMLDRIWSRIAPALSAQEADVPENARALRDRAAPGGTMIRGWPRRPQHPRRTALMRRLELLVAVAFVAVLIGSAAFVFSAIRGAGSGNTTASPASCATLLPGSGPLGSIGHFPEVALPADTNPMATGPETSGGGPGQFTLIAYNVCFTGSASDVNGPLSAHHSLSATLFGSGWRLTPTSFPFDAQYHRLCSGAQACYFSGDVVAGRQLEVDSVTDHGGHLITFHLILAFPPPAPSCNANFTNSPIQGIQTTTATAYGAVPLPPLSRVVPDNAAGHGGTDVCSAGTVATVASFLLTYMPQSGWTLHSASNGQQVWKSSTGCIAISVSDPTQWVISWPNPGIGQPFADCT